MLCTLEYINNHTSTFLARMFFQHCDRRMILFLAEIVINLLDGVIGVIKNDKRPYLKFRSLLEKVYKYSVKMKTNNGKKEKTKVNISLSQQRAVFSSPKGLQLIKLLFNIVQNRQFTR